MNNKQMTCLPLGGQPRAVNYNLVISAKLQAAKPLPIGGQQPRVNYNLVITLLPSTIPKGCSKIPPGN